MRLRAAAAAFSDRCPEFWALATSAVAWLVLARRAGIHIHSPTAAANWRHWMLMVVAMMLPLQIQSVRLTAERSLWNRRNRAIVGYLMGYLSVWAVAGVPLALACGQLGPSARLDWKEGTAVGLLIAAGWLISPGKRLAAQMCHRAIPLSPKGWRADLDCLTYGWVGGLGCAMNCWPLMLMCWLSTHSFIAMTVGFGLGLVDRYDAPNYRVHAAAAAASSLMFVALSRIR